MQECLSLLCICVPSLQPQRIWGNSIMLSCRHPVLLLVSPSQTSVVTFFLFQDCPDIGPGTQQFQDEITC